ncbi:cadherin domain-containing protein [Ekhidna sp.]|uniref:cadherin domain-containing protein n=1 Tax=Ekhidna sp. TaxID=2608089 RepID=UPI003296BDAA
MTNVLVKKIFLLVFMLIMMGMASAQSISYGYIYDLSNASQDAGTYALSTYDTGPQDISFNNDGTKLFIVGTGSDAIHQFSLATPYEARTGLTHEGSFSVLNEQVAVNGFSFNTSGTKLFTIGGGGPDHINQYSLATPFVITSGVTHDGTPYSTSDEENDPRGITFSDDGLKLFVVGANGDEVNQYTLNSSFDITAGLTHNGFFSVASEQTAPSEIEFSADGTRMFIVGTTGDIIHQYELTNSFDITSGVSYSGKSLYVGAQEGFPTGITFDGDGHKMYIVGTLDREINQYNLNVGGFSEALDNDGSLDGSIDIQIEGETFTNANSTLTHGVDFSIINLPAGLTPTLAITSDGASATLTLLGNAGDHQDIDGVADLQFTFENSAFTGGNASAVENAIAASSNLGINFDDNNAALTYGFFHDLSNGATPVSTFSILSEEGTSTGLAFSSDGLNLFVVGSGDDEVNQYSLTTAFDISSGVSHTGLLDVSADVTAPNGITFNNDGTKMYLTGFENFGKVFPYSLSTPFDVTSGVTFDGYANISGQEGTPQGIAFNSDGTKMYIVGSAGDEVNQYSLLTPFDVSLSSVVFDDVTVSVSSEDTFPADIKFNPDGTKMFIVGAGGKDINQYSLAIPFDLSAGVTFDGSPFSVTAEETGPTGMAFSDDGSKLFIVGSLGDEVNQYTVNVGGFEESSANDGSVAGSLTIHLVEDVFTNQGGTLTHKAHYSIHNTPAGLIPNLAIALDGKTGTLTFGGNATNHQDINDISSLTFTFVDVAFISGDAAAVNNAVEASSEVGIDFNDNPYLNYGVCYDLSNGTIQNETSFDISSQSTAPHDLTFNNDGTKLYVLDGDREIYQYNLSTPYDANSGTYSGISFSVASEEVIPSALNFNNDGTKLYVLGESGDDVTQYSLTTPFDISTGISLDGTFSVSAQETSPSDFRFNADGSKMFVVGYNSDLVRQYSLTTPFDVTAGGSLDGSYNPTATAFNPSRLDFSADGTKMFVDLHQFSLSNAFDITSGVSADGYNLVAGPNTTGSRFDPDGKTITAVSWSDDVIYQYDIVVGGFVETEENDGSVEGSLLVSLTGDTFTNAGSTLTETTDYTIDNLLSGLTPTLTVAADGLSATLTLGGNAALHQEVNDLASLTFTFENSAFTNSNSAAVIDAISASSEIGIDFTQNEPVLVYDYAYNPANFAGAGNFGVLAQEGSAHGITFNNDGTKVYIVGTSNDQVFQYSLSTAYDVTTATLDGSSTSLNAQDDSPLALAFNDTGSRLFIAGGISESILEYTLSTPYDVTSGFSYSNNSLDVSAQGYPNGLAFSSDGLKLFTTSANTDQVSQFSLISAYNISSGATLDGSYSVSDQENTPNGIAFSESGTKMVIMGSSTQASQKYVHNYHLENAYDITSGVSPYENPVNINAYEFGPTDIAFSNNGDRMFIVGVNGNEINQFDMQAGSMAESASNDGTITGSYVLQLYDELFANVAGTLTQGVDYNISNLPAGLSSSISVSADGKTGTLTVSGTATSHDASDDVEGLIFTFENSSFSIGNASIVAHVISANSELSIRFIEAPSIGTQTFSIAENSVNTTSVGTVIASDGNGDEITFSITAGNDLGGFAIDPNSGEITVADQTDMDFETNPSFDLTVEVTDGSLTNSATITIDLTNVDEAPTDIALDQNDMDENNAVNDVIGQLATTDEDAGETYTYTLVSGTGDTDNASFNINGDQLRASVSFNHESKDTYSIRVQTDDGNSGLFEKAFTININDVFETPTDINLFGTSINENNTVDTEIGTLFTTDDDGGETHTYTLVSGTGDTDNASFNILDDKLRASESFNFEVKDSYGIRIQTNDGNGGTFEEQFTITVNDVSEAPTDITLSGSEITENNSINDAIGVLSSTDEDAAETYFYSLVSGTGDTGNASFNIDGDQLRASEIFDFETTNSYSIRVQTNDGNFGVFEKVFTVTINNQQEAPTDILLSSSDIDESSPIGTTVGNLSTTDEDNGETYTYTLISGIGDTDNASFNISGDELRSAEIFDYEAKTNYSVRVQTNDGNGGLFEKAFTISINDQPPGLTGVGITSNTIVENEGIGSDLGNLFALGDEIEGVTFTFTLIPGTGDTDNGSFTIVGEQLRNSISFDHESQSQYSVRVMADDGAGSTIEQILLIDIVDINEAPSLVDVNENEYNEGLTSGTILTDFFVSDEDDSDSHSFSLVSGAGSSDNDKFEIQGQNLANLEAFDFESQSEYSIRVRATDAGGLSVESIIAIFVNDVNDNPTEIIFSSTQIDENSSIGSVSTMSSTDQDAGDSHIYSLVSGLGDADNALFTISGNSLEINFVPDYEVRSSYALRIQTDDSNGGTFQKAVVITINDLNEDPTDIDLSNNTVEESNPIGTLVGSLSSTDEDAGQSHTYTFVTGTGDTDNGSFTISGGDLLSGEVFDFETKNSYSVRVQSSDGNGGLFEKSFTISIDDLPASITSFELNNATINENKSTGSIVGSFSTSGEDLSGSFTYSLVSGTGDDDNTVFTISGGQLLTGASFDFELQNSYSIRVMVDDGTGNTDEKAFTIMVNDVSEVPTALLLSANSINENNSINDIIGNFTTEDEDMGETHTYTLASGSGDDDNGSFMIVESELQAAETFDFEIKSSYSIRVETNDGNGGLLQDVFTISINDLDENSAPSATHTLSDVSLDNGFTIATRDLALTFVDADGDPITLSSASSDEGVATVDFTGTTLNMYEEGTGTTTITVTADDGNGGVATADFELTINFVAQEAPTAIALSNNTVDENSSVSTLVGQLSATDVNIYDEIIYSLVAGTGDENNDLFSISGFNLRTNAVLDFDATPSLSIRIQADDQNGGTFEEVFTILVNDLGDNESPIVNTNLFDLSEQEGFGSAQIDLSNTFSDPDGDNLTLSVFSSDETVSTASLNGTILTLTEVGNGSTTITVAANDGNGGSVSDEFVITVNNVNDAPVIINPLNDQTDLVEGFGAAQINYSDVFEDPDGDALTISVSSSDESVVIVEVIANDQIQINEVGVGTATITLTANDGNGESVSDEFIVTVSEAPNNAPIVVNPLGDQTDLVEGFDAAQINYSDVFEDPDGDALTISVSSSDESVVIVEVIANDQIQINEVSVGTATITLTANDGNGESVSDEFIVTVSEAPNNAPIVVNPLGDQTDLAEGFDAAQINYSDVFEDPDGDALTVSVNSNDESVVTVEVIANDQIQLNEIGIGTATITLTADDGNGGSVSDAFIVTVKEALSNETDILEFSEPTQTVPAVIDAINHTVSITIQPTSDLIEFNPTIILSEGATYELMNAFNGLDDLIYTVTAEDGLATQDWIVTVIVDFSSTNGLEDEIDLQIYPNPTTDFLKVNTSETITAEVTNLEGRQVISRVSGTSLKLNVTSLSSGVYLLVITKDQKTSVKRFIKAN